ncbi:protein PRRC2A isoform X2 [Anoplophora glabripennis]|uniref:protein PRRC2A isoform X2 n=1 Tax=Anoplophora glabripennis TaxID=217634 RepID=UPI0008744437|nr:protein PRRC2A isoform X2 [Anoplophora glabripennis]
MSTLSGQASKGEKTKPKFQSLDINSLYRVSRGENLEKQQQKSSSIYIKHGMQSLGKVPNARRAPANLPSLKAEHSGTDAAVPLVPPGAPGWGKQDPSTTAVPQQQQPVAPTSQMPNAPNPSAIPQNATQQPAPQISPHQAAIALPVTTTIPPHGKQLTPSVQPAPTDKLWSSVMSCQDAPHPPLYQSPQFQHEFPSLSSGDGGPTRTGSDAPYPSGLSLRPQTEGSWTQGGQRPGTEAAGPPRSSSVPPGAPPQLSAQAGLPPPQQQQQFPPQIRGVMPSFMYKGSNFQQGSGIGIQNQNTPSPVNGRGGAARPADNRPPRLADRDREVEDIVPRPIIKDEELTRMAEIGKDMGWADSDEIDYNQKLAFSDDESDRPLARRDAKKNQQQMRENRESDKSDGHPNDIQRQWSGSRSSRGRSSEEEDIWSQRRSQATKEMEIVVQRAKQRKEEEEKRFNQERRQGAAKKLMELEEKIQKRDRDNQEGVGTINPSTVPPKPINHVDIPLPEFQKEKERDRDNRSRTPNELSDGKNQPGGSSFKHLTQIEGKNFPRKHQKQSEQRDRERNVRENGASFSKQFQNDLPPRFLKHQRNNSNSGPQGQGQFHQFDGRWAPGQVPPKPQQPGRNARQDSPDTERNVDDYPRQNPEDGYRGQHHAPPETAQKPQDGRYDDLQDVRHQPYDQQYSLREREEDKRQKDKEDAQRHPNYDQQYNRRERDDEKWHKEKKQESDDWGEKRDKPRDEKPLDRYDRLERERPQRPDSRDSRSTRHSRDSEPRDYMSSWSESVYEPPYEEKSRDHPRDDRRAVPGPITKDRIEADDMRNEKRNLTQLKRGQPVVVKSEMKKDEKEESDGKKDSQAFGTWADSIPPALEESEHKFEEEKKLDPKQFGEQTKKPDKLDDYKERNRGRQHSGNKGWGPSWQKRPPSRGHKSGRQAHDYHGTDSDASMDEHPADKNDQKGDMRSEPRDRRSPKLSKDEKNRDKQEKGLGDQRKQDKPEKKENYVPRGEPSRHGRGGGNFRSGRMGGLGKRIDGYGPPPSKSPFGHHDDKEKKVAEESAVESPLPVEDKTKLNQQALTAGIMGKSRVDPAQSSDEKNKARGKPDPRKNKPRGKDELCDTNSENSDEKDKKDGRKLQDRKTQAPRPQNPPSRGRNNPPRLGGEKRSYDVPRGETASRQNSNNSLKKDDKPSNDHNVLANAIADIPLKNHDDADPVDEKEDKVSLNGDSEGFQEVKSKKTGKERQKSVDDKQQCKNPSKNEPGKDLPKTERDRDRKPKTSAVQLTQQQIQNIPSLMATPVNPPPVLPQPKGQFDRPRQSKLAPRFAKQKLQKAQMQQQVHGLCDVNDLNKVNQSLNVYGMKEVVSVSAPVSSCAWDKPLGSQLRGMEHDGMLGVAIDSVKGLDQTQQASQGASPNTEKMMGKPGQLQDKTLLDGSTPPVNTIIFENTNFKSAPGARNARTDKPRPKLEDGAIDPSVMAGFKPTMNELLQSKNDSKSEPIQLPLFKEDSADMKLDFFGSDLQFTDDKGAKTLMSKSIHAITSGNNTVDSLDIKIASVKKVWETSEQEGEETQISFGGPPLDPNVFSQGKDTPDDNHEGYSPSPNQTASTTTNVKPTQQVSGSGQTALSGAGHQQHSGIVAPGLMGNPLSPPPPIPQVLGASVGIGPQQYTANQHIGYQAGLSGSTQYGMSAIPSPPTVPLVYNSTQQLQAAAAQSAGLYGAFQIDQTGVLGGQGRSQYSQYPNYHGLGQTASSPYSTQSVYLQTAPPHPPPTAQAPPELYPNLNNYRLSATAPFGQSQQLNNPTTVLISSTSNSLMSASVKPSSQPISAIGTKAGGVGQAYQQQSQQGQQVYMAYDPSIQAANYLPPSAGVMQRGPAGPVQNNVVPGLQPSSSYYSGSTGGQTGYYQQPGSSTLSSAQLQQHQAGYGLQGNVFGTHSQSHTNTGLQNYSPFLPTSLQMAAAINAQQFRSGMPAPYMKGVGDQSGRPQQLKSPSSQEVLSSVFNSGSQIPSPKSRQNCKHPPPQSSPTAQHKYNLYQGVGGQQNPNMQRYPAPIQRPMNFQQMQQSNTVNQKHRNNPNNKAPNRQYYGGQNNSLGSQGEKPDDPKMGDGVSLGGANPPTNPAKAAIGTGASVTVNAASEKVKDNMKEETAVLKD